MSPVLREVADVIDEHTGLSRVVLEYGLLMKQIVDRAKEPGFSADTWAPIAALVDTERFERVGNFKEVMTWPEYVDFLTGWAPAASWACSFKRVSELGNLVFLELEERSELGDFSSSVNSLSVYEFDDEGRLVHLDIYLQMALPSMDILESYEGIEITEG